MNATGKNKTIKMPHDSDARDGFVLPYVLVVVFVLALASTIAVRSINAAGQVVSELSADLHAEQRLTSAEADTLYTYMTSAGVRGGIDTSYTSWTSEEVVDGFDISRLSPNALWSASGGQRLARFANGEVRITYRDASGLIPINRNDPGPLQTWLQSMGVRSEEAKTMAAKLGDYIDADTRRRFRGGERSEYRLKRREPPTNFPLRVHEEMYHILEWDKVITPSLYASLRADTTLTTTTSYYRTKFLSPALADRLDLDGAKAAIGEVGSREIDFLDAATATVETPTRLGRFLLSTPRGTGQTIIRAVELERSPGAPDQPFRRRVVFEEIVDDGEIIESDTNGQERGGQEQGEIPSFVFATPDRAAQ